MKTAETLLLALPYMREYRQKYIVIKYGGQAMVNRELMESVASDLGFLQFAGIKPVLVHGGGKDVTALMEKIGKKPLFVDGLRVTDDETMELVEMVLMGKVNQEIVGLINARGAGAVGLSGRDGLMVKAERIQYEDMPGHPVDLGRVGVISRVDPTLVHLASDNGYIPVISCIGSGPDGESLNINADHVAAHIAAALQAVKLLLLTDVDGIYFGPEGEKQPLSSIRREEIGGFIESGEISGGMIPKVKSCLLALGQGVKKVHIVDGRVPHCLLQELFTSNSSGTVIL